jgi:hypothetical protein
VWAALGGGPLRNGRGQARWRNGDGWNVSVRDGRGWFDHRDSRGGGVPELVETVLGCDRKRAIAWLAETFGLDIDGNRSLTPGERRRYSSARAEAAELVAWREEEVRSLRELRNFHLYSFYRLLHLILTHGLSVPGTDRWADAAEQHEIRYQNLDTQIDQFEALPMNQVVIMFRRAGRVVA